MKLIGKPGDSAGKAKNPEEAKGFIQEAARELSFEDMEKVSGGSVSRVSLVGGEVDEWPEERGIKEFWRRRYDDTEEV